VLNWKQKKRRESVLEIFFIYKNGGNGGGKKNQAGKERHLDHYPAPGWGRAVGERKEYHHPR
jgi:hypothetical protein